MSARTGLDCSYQQYAWGSDELLPVSNAGLDNNGHVGITLVEALDTLWLMGMRKEFDAAVKWIRESLSLDVNMEVSALTTTRGCSAACSPPTNSVDAEFCWKRRWKWAICCFGPSRGAGSLR